MTWFNRLRKQPRQSDVSSDERAAAGHGIECPKCERHLGMSAAVPDEFVLCQCGALLDVRGGVITAREPDEIDSCIRTVPLIYQPDTTSDIAPQIFLTKRDVEAYARKTMKFVQYTTPDILIVGLDKKDDGTIYEVYSASSRVAALEYLKRIPATEIPPLYYVVVETPFGNVGKDLKGVYDEDSPKQKRELILEGPIFGRTTEEELGSILEDVRSRVTARYGHLLLETEPMGSPNEGYTTLVLKTEAITDEQVQEISRFTQACFSEHLANRRR